MSVLELRPLTKQDVENPKFIFGLPVAFKGEPWDVKKYAKDNGYKFKKDRSVYGGHYVRPDGDCLLIT